ncbi:hypothetical protein BH09PSE2_BH09PSE2_23750 [soil metagenome]
MHRLLILAPSLLLIYAAQAPQTVAPSPPPPAGLSVKAVMRHVVNPAAELYWKAAGEVDSAAGEAKRVPKPGDDARWAATLDAAYQLEEAGAALTLPIHARDSDQWMKLSKKLADAGAQAVAAAEARDEAKTFDAGSALYDACFACHAKYIPRPKNSLYNQKLPDDAFKPPT